MIQKILCSTDLTVNSTDSIAYGLTLAKENRAQLIIFHTTSFPCLAQYPHCELELVHEWDQLVSKFKVGRVLAEAECKVRNFLYANFGVDCDGSSCKVRVALGKVAEEMVTAAIQEEVDIIILARRNMRALSQFFTRSVSATVSRNAPCPVVLIGPSQYIRRSSVWRLARLEVLGQHSQA
jgi:nucleotide-binding universal stress UspA family protein